MKISILNDEIIIDLTSSDFGKVQVNKEIIFQKNNFLIPVINNIPKKIMQYNKFKINPYFLNCTCKEYKNRIKMFPRRDLRRICKHIFAVIMRDFESRIDPLSKVLMEHQFWEKISEVYQIKFMDELIYLSFDEKMSFLYVYRRKTNWKFYKYYPKKKVWANEMLPFRENSQNDFLVDFLNNYIINRKKILPKIIC